MSAPAPRKTRPRGDERRRLIVEVAFRLFAERGYNSVGIAEVAAEAGLSQAGLLHHFPTKSDLLLAVLEERDRRVTPGGDGGVPETGDFFTDYLGNLAANDRQPQLVKLFAILSAESISDDHPAHGWFARRYENMIEDITAIIAPLIDPGAHPGIDARTIAQWLIGLADGLRTQALLVPGSVDRHESIGRFVALIRPYLRDPDDAVATEG